MALIACAVLAMSSVEFVVGLYVLLGEEKFQEWLKCMGQNQPIIQRGHTQRMNLMLSGDHAVQGDNFLYVGAEEKKKDPKTPYAIVYSAPIRARMVRQFLLDGGGLALALIIAILLYQFLIPLPLVVWTSRKQRSCIVAWNQIPQASGKPYSYSPLTTPACSFTSRSYG